MYRTGFRANDAYSEYLDMGAPAKLTQAQIERLQSLTRDLPEADRRVRSDATGVISVRIPMRPNDIVLVTLEPAR